MSPVTKTKRRKGFKKNTYTRKQKQNIADRIYEITETDVLDDFNKLKEIGCAYHKELSQIGNKVVNKYTLIERLNIYGHSKMNFYDVWKNKNTLRKVQSIEKMVQYYKTNNPSYAEIKVWFRISNLYYSAISIFKPLIAMDIYCRYKPTAILDFTMGWGGRLVGACALDIPKYIGIDMNSNLKMPYQHLSKFLTKNSKTDIQLFFQDALTVDYSKLNYDLVLTSPPYYDVEVYGANQVKSKEKWNAEFYAPIFEMTFKYLKRGGHYCLNVPEEVYKSVAIKVLGKCTTKIPLPKSKRTAGEKYHEYIYVWAK
jgi:ribosomal protein S15P/S13E